ncbi:MAG: antitoxin AF2212-like protein [Anaerolineae bacterium]
MLRQICEAIFENGVFRLLSPLDIAIPEGQQVRLITSAELRLR